MTNALATPPISLAGADCRLAVIEILARSLRLCGRSTRSIRRRPGVRLAGDPCPAIRLRNLAAIAKRTCRDAPSERRSAANADRSARACHPRDDCRTRGRGARRLGWSAARIDDEISRTCNDCSPRDTGFRAAPDARMHDKRQRNHPDACSKLGLALSGAADRHRHAALAAGQDRPDDPDHDREAVRSTPGCRRRRSFASISACRAPWCARPSTSSCSSG